VYGAGAFFRRDPMISILKENFYPILTGRTAKSLLSGDDVEWCWLLQLKGFRIYYDENLKFFHDLSVHRLTTDYYIKHKIGTTASGALLFAYRSFFKHRRLSEPEFLRRYELEFFKNKLRYLKNRIFKKNRTWEDELAMAILRSRKVSFSQYREEAASLYANLKVLFPNK
jgi:GT2 family glycosyltransferase